MRQGAMRIQRLSRSCKDIIEHKERDAMKVERTFKARKCL